MDTRYAKTIVCVRKIKNYVLDLKVLNKKVKGIKFLEKNSSKYSFIRDNILTATRNYHFRVRSFIRTIVMNSFSEMCCKFYSYRVEFQLRGK